MNKKLLLVLLSVLFIPGINAFAQFKMVAESPRNLKNLERVVMRSIKGPAIGRPVVTGLPVSLVPGGSIGLLRVKMPKVITPVSSSYVRYVNTLGGGRPSAVPHNWVGLHGEHVLYNNPNQLARDLDAFYQGDAVVYEGLDGRKVKLYMLPVDGILYRSLEHALRDPFQPEVPLVLNSDEYFVVYDVKSQTGKILENTPQV